MTSLLNCGDAPPLLRSERSQQSVITRRNDKYLELKTYD